jgi:hypothetical protein
VDTLRSTSFLAATPRRAPSLETSQASKQASIGAAALSQNAARMQLTRREGKR